MRFSLNRIICILFTFICISQFLIVQRAEDRFLTNVLTMNLMWFWSCIVVNMWK